jgi:hypothetical protein
MAEIKKTRALQKQVTGSKGKMAAKKKVASSISSLLPTRRAANQFVAYGAAGAGNGVGGTEDSGI